MKFKMNFKFIVVILPIIFFSSCFEGNDEKELHKNDPSVYTVSFDSQNASILANPISKTVTSPVTLIDSLPAEPTKTGYTFNGWYTAKRGCGTSFNAETTVAADITVYAKWISTSGLYVIGDIGPSGVGIVFYITDGGLHGLEVAPLGWWNGYLNDPSSPWISGGTSPDTLNGNTSTSIGTGLANSNYIIAQSGHVNSAAKLCRSYTGGSKTDWFLPSKDELEVLWVNLVRIEYTGTVEGIQWVNSGECGLNGSSYWSSSENTDYPVFGDGTSWSWYLIYGGQSIHDKISGLNVRPVRAF